VPSAPRRCGMPARHIRLSRPRSCHPLSRPYCCCYRHSRESENHERRGQPLAGKHKPGSAVDVGRVAVWPPGSPERRFANHRRRSRAACSSCFIRSRSGDSNSLNCNAHPPTGADAHEITLRIWQCRVVYPARSSFSRKTLLCSFTGRCPGADGIHQRHVRIV
jgi:hypothetical protein